MDSRLLWLALAGFVGSTEGGLIAGLLPSISEDMGVSIGQAGQVVLGYSLAYAIGTPLLSALLGGVGRRRILAGAELTLAICALLMALAPAFGWLVAARTLLALGAGLFTSTALATAAMIAAPGERGRALQIVTFGQTLAVLIGVPVAAFVAAHYSWRFDYLSIGLAALAAALALYFRLPKGMHGDQQTLGARVRVLGNRGVPGALLTTLLFMVAAYLPLVYIGAVMAEAGLGRDLLPFILLANGIGAIIASVTAGRLADRIGNRMAVSLSTLALLASLGLFGVLPYLLPELRFAALMGAMGIMGYVGWAYWIAHCSEMAHLAPSSVPVAISLDLTALNIGTAFAAFAGGAIVDRIGAHALPLAGAPLVLAALAVWLLVTRGRAS